MEIGKRTEQGAAALSPTTRRTFLKFAVIGAAASTSVACRSLAPSAEAGNEKAKVIFVLFKRADLTDEQCLAEWSGDRHVSVVRTIPGLRRWVQNHVSPVPEHELPTGIGELWFDDAQSMDEAMNSPEMAAAVEDAKNFLDMEKTYAVVVDEIAIIA